MALSATMPLAARRGDALPALADERLSMVTDLTGFLAMRAEWDALFARSAMPHQVFQSHAVLRHWASHYLDAGQRLAILVGRRNGRLAMIWPLVRQRRLGVSTLRFMGNPVAQFGDVLVEEDAAELIEAGWRTIGQSGADLLEIRKLRSDSVLARAGIPEGFFTSEQEEAPFADLTRRVGSDGGPSDAYSPRDRSNYRRRLRRLAESGALALRRLEPGDETAMLAHSAVAMKRAALARHGVIAPAIADSRFAAFFASMAADEDSPLRIALVERDGAPIGIDLSLDCKGTTFGHVIATGPEHERGGVGGILAHHSFASAKARGSAVFDLLAPADAYKRDHSDGATVVRDITAPLSLTGRIVCMLGLPHLRPLAKRAAKTAARLAGRGLERWGGGSKS